MNNLRDGKALSDTPAIRQVIVALKMWILNSFLFRMSNAICQIMPCDVFRVRDYCNHVDFT